MKFTDQELLAAVHEAGRGRESFTCADVRKQLRVSTKDRRKLSQFHRAFQSFQKGAVEDLEKLGNNCYRLRVQTQVEPVEIEAAQLIELQLDVAALARETGQPIDVYLDLDATAEQATQAFDLQPAPEPIALAAAQPIELQLAVEVPAPDATQALDIQLDSAAFMEELAAPQFDLHQDHFAASDMHVPQNSQVAGLGDVLLVEEVANEDRLASDETAEPPALRGWRDRAQWLGKRVAQLFGAADASAGTAA